MLRFCLEVCIKDQYRMGFLGVPLEYDWPTLFVVVKMADFYIRQVPVWCHGYALIRLQITLVEIELTD